MAKKKSAKGQMSLSQGKEANKRSGGKSSKADVPDQTPEPLSDYNGLTVDALMVLFAAVAEKYEAIYRNAGWNGTSCIELGTSSKKAMFELIEEVRGLSVSYRFRSVINISVRGNDDVYDISAILPGKVVDNKG